MRAGVLVFMAVGLVGVTGCERTDGSVDIPGSYTVRAENVNLRDGGEDCDAEPGTGNCSTVLFSLDPGHKLYPLCQRQGQLVGRNSWWVYVDGPRGNRGWVASWYLTCPTKILPGIDECTSERLED
jgi:hypothetical protein